MVLFIVVIILIDTLFIYFKFSILNRIILALNMGSRFLRVLPYSPFFNECYHKLYIFLSLVVLVVRCLSITL